jgi:hypothetical protein
MATATQHGLTRFDPFVGALADVWEFYDEEDWESFVDRAWHHLTAFAKEMGPEWLAVVQGYYNVGEPLVGPVHSANHPAREGLKRTIFWPPRPQVDEDKALNDQHSLFGLIVDALADVDQPGANRQFELNWTWENLRWFAKSMGPSWLSVVESYCNFESRKEGPK